MINKKQKTFMSDIEKQNIPLPREINPQNAFTRLSIFAMHAASKYKLKNFKLESDKGENKTPNTYEPPACQ